MFPAMRAGLARRRIGAAFAVLAFAASANAADKPATEVANPPAQQTDAETFCANVGDAARDARFAWEARTLTDLKAEIETKTTELETKRAELEEWVSRREEFQKLAEQGVVDIYAKMRPDAAATQLGSLEPEMAAAIIAKLNSRTASTILAEMDARRAASLAALIAGTADAAEPTVASQ